MPPSRSIGQVILRQTLPTLITLATLSTIALFTGIFVIVNGDVQRRHSDRVEKVTETYNQAINDQMDQLSSIATNNFLYEALEEPSTLSTYFLRSYLESLDFGVRKFANIHVIDTQGHVVASNDIKAVQQSLNLANMPWFNQVLVRLVPYQNTTVRHIEFVVPIIKNGVILGAIIAQFESLDPFLVFNFDESVVLITNLERRILYTSDRVSFSPFSIIEWNILKDWRVAYESEIDGLTIVGLEQSYLIFQEFYRLLGFALLSITFVFISSWLSARAAGKLAAGTIDRFLASVTSKREHPETGNAIRLHYEARELERLGSEFQKLLDSLSESNLSIERVSALMNSLNDLLVVFDFSGSQTLSNKAFDTFVENTGLPSDDLLEHIFFGQNAEEILQLDHDFIPVEKHYLAKDSDSTNPYFTVKWTRHVQVNDYGKIIGVTFVGMDTTKSNELEEEIELKEAAIDGAESGIIILDINEQRSTVIYANKGVEKLTEIDHEHILGEAKNLLNYANSLSNQAAFDRIRHATLAGQSIVEILKRELKDGTSTSLEISLSPVSLPRDTRKRYYLGILKDVTEQQLTSELLIEAKQRAEESAQMKSSFLASMSHEIRTPMNGVIGMLDILDESKLDEQQKNYVNIAQNSAESLLTIINDILDFSKVEAGKLTMDNIDFNLSDMLDGFVDSMAHQAHSKNLELILDASEIEQKFVQGDPGRLRQIMTNLVGNAIKFTQRGEIIIKANLSETSDNKQLLTMTIKDTGIGIPHEKQAHLFDPFTQVDGSDKRAQQGTGLGLAIVKQLCEAMNGHVWINSIPERGSTFGFRIELFPSSKSVQDLPQLNVANKRVMVIDDNESNRTVLCKQLQKWNLDVSVFESGLEAIEQLKNNEGVFDAAIVDMNMPEMDGALFGKEVRKLPAHENMKLVLMTSISQRGDAQHFASLGFDGYFPKPATSSDIIDALSILFDQGQALDNAEPLVTQHYVRSLRHDQSFSKEYRILLVEDNPVNQMISKKYIQNIGLHATLAQDGQVAIDRLKEADAPYDLVLMDCQMPVLDGFEATRKIRTGEAGDRYLNTPIIAMTANAMKGDRERCLEVGMDDYISKPLRKDVLVKILKSWLARLP